MKRSPEKNGKTTPVYACNSCGQDIYDGETYWDIDGIIVCDDCCAKPFAIKYLGCRPKIATSRNKNKNEGEQR